MKQFIETEFDKVYDELSKLNEGSVFKNYLSTFTGYINGEPMQDTNDVLLNYVDIEKSIKENPDLANLDINKWPAFGNYWFKCPKCNREYLSVKRTLWGKCRVLKERSKKYNINIPTSRLAWCGTCGSSDKSNQDNKSIIDIPVIWNRIPNEIVDKNTGILTNDGRQEIYRINNIEHPGNIGNDKHQVSQELLDIIYTNKEFNFGRAITKSTELFLPFICPICNTSYVSKPSSVARSIYAGCQTCLDKSKGSNSSNSELLLREVLKSIQAFKLFDYKPIKFNKVDICLEYAGNKFAIEYDGKKSHDNKDTIDVDIRKTKKCIEDGYKVIRVRDSGCAPFTFTDESAKIIILPSNKCFSYLSKDNFIKVMQELCNEIGYKLTENDLNNILKVFNAKSNSKWAKAERTKLSSQQK